VSQAETIGAFGDQRRQDRGAWLLDRIVETGSLVIRKIGGGRAGEMAAHRFLASPEVTVGEIVETVGARAGGQCLGRRIVAVQDTSEINFNGRDAARRGLGAGANGEGCGFFMHPVIAVDADDEAVIGLLDAQIWTRPQKADGTACRQRRERRLDDKESARWLNGAIAAGQRAAGARQLIVVGDRESDIYPLFARHPPHVDVLVRAAQDRALEDGGLLFQKPAAWPCLGSYDVQVAPRGLGDRGRIAKVSVRAGTVRIKRPANKGADRSDPAVLELTMVEAREEIPSPGQIPLLWRLVTTLPAETLEQAADIVRLYRLRWRIEQTFRATKSDGLGLPDVQIQDAKRLLTLAAVALVAAVRTIQLVDARDGGARPATDVVDEELLDAAEAIGPTLEGKTARQKNPHRARSLAWLAWIIARLGGWNCYYKPPGPKTMRSGWDRFAAMAAGYLIAHGRPLSPRRPLL